VPNFTSENVYDRNLPSTFDNQMDVDLHVTPTSTNNKLNESADVTLNIRRTIKTYTSCIICKSTNNLKKVTLRAQSYAFINFNIIIPSGVRCCSSHLSDGLLSEDAMKKLRVFSVSTIMPIKELERLIQEARKIALKKGLDFDIISLSDDDYYQLTDVSRNDFEIMANCIKKTIRSTSTRSYRTCLAVVLLKFRIGLSHSILSVFLK